MSASVASRFADPQAYEATVRAADVTGYIVHKRGLFGADLTRVSLNRLWVQQGVEVLPRTAHYTTDERRAPILFLADADTPSLINSGLEITPSNIVLLGRGAAHFQRTEGPCRWATMSLAPADLEAAMITLADCSLEMPSDSRLLKPSPAALRRLRALHGFASRLGQAAPKTLNHPQVARALEQSLTAAMVACLAQDSGQAHGVTWHRRQRVMKAFRDWLDQHLDQPVHLLDMCQALGVPARTLRLCCQEQLGMSPIQYLFLRRMRLARDRLISSDGSTSTVTTIAMDCGFWELGRFSVAYHNLYGERPSATLARAPQPPPGARPFE